MASSDTLSVSKSTVRRITYLIGGIVLAVLIVVLAVVVVQRLGPSDALASQVKSGDYQAVFLTNNEVYFGNLTVPSGSFVYLRHVYRLTSQVGKSGKPLRSTLVKIVNDLHSPEDLMVINRANILYIENLNPSGQASRLMRQGGP
jgi:hypothetical protein